jgi:hypothetical protein
LFDGDLADNLPGGLPRETVIKVFHEPDCADKSRPLPMGLMLAR